MYDLLMKKIKNFKNETEATKNIEKYFKKGILTNDELENLKYVE